MLRKAVIALAILTGIALVFGGTVFALSLIAPHNTNPAANADAGTTIAATAPATPDTPSETPSTSTATPKAASTHKPRVHQVTATPTHKASPKATRSATATPSPSSTTSTTPSVPDKFLGAWHSDNAGTTLTVGPTEQYPNLNPNQGILAWDSCATCIVKISYKVAGSTLVGTVTNSPQLPPSIVGLHQGSQLILTPDGSSKLDVTAPGVGDATTYYLV